MGSDKGGKNKFKHTVFLPKTEFSMKADLKNKELSFLEKWDEEEISEKFFERAKNKAVFCLHDGPPYANGHLHIGHAMNKILKDIIVRSQRFLGSNVHYVPGWDCHGLPIEWKVEEQYRGKSLSKDDVPILKFRKSCRDFASKWIAVQKDEFRRFGIMANWDNYYCTMTNNAEAKIAEEFLNFVMNETLYQGVKPVMWSIAEKTALAEAEVEYMPHESRDIYVKFPVALANDEKPFCVVIWTTTPWTIPMNKALAFSPEVEYALYEVNEVEESSLLKPGELLLLAKARAKYFFPSGKVSNWSLLRDFDPSSVDFCRHPLNGIEGGSGFWDYNIPMLKADFANDEVGTGFVHMAPSHGIDDYNLAMKNNLSFTNFVMKDGTYSSDIPILGGQTVFEPDGSEGTANNLVINMLDRAGSLVYQGKFTHSYPHSWRSKTPLIYRTTPQWFINIDKPLHSLAESGGQEKQSIRQISLKAVNEKVNWFPESGRNRIRNMLEDRPDWLVSRQRLWGVPMSCFVNKNTGELLRDCEVNKRIVDSYKLYGSDVWYEEGKASEFLGSKYSLDDWEKVDDLLDVWFDSGVTHAFVLDDSNDKDLWPASLYLEGTDQHRGWFQSSLLEACATRGMPPYKAVLTHGFVLDEKGEKMSKSKGNVVSPLQVSEQYGADILRLWVMQSDCHEDLRIGSGIIKGTADSYRRIRNTIRYIVASLDGFEDSEVLDFSEMTEVDRYILHRTFEIDQIVRECYSSFRFQKLFGNLFGFCTSDLSSFYLDVKKDVLYCSDPSSKERRSYRTVLDILFKRILKWFAPVLVFTADEAWRNRYPGKGSVHLQSFEDEPLSWKNLDLAEKWDKVRNIRKAFDAEVEAFKSEGKVKSSLDVEAHLYLKPINKHLLDVDFEEVFISSGSNVKVVEKLPDSVNCDTFENLGFCVLLELAQGLKCERCRKSCVYVEDDVCQEDRDILCERCIACVY